MKCERTFGISMCGAAKPPRAEILPMAKRSYGAAAPPARRPVERLPPVCPFHRPHFKYRFEPPLPAQKFPVWHESPPAVTCFAGARSRRTDLRVFFRASGRHAPSGTGADPGRAASHFIGAALGRFAADFCSAPFLSGRFSRPGRPGTGSRIWLYLRKGEALFG